MDIKSKVTGEKMEVVLSGVLDTRTAPELEKEVMGRIGEVNEIVFDLPVRDFVYFLLHSRRWKTRMALWYCIM